MSIELIAKTIETAGTLLIAYAAIKVHYRVKEEHKIDSKVLKEMNVEFRFGVLGMILIITSYLLDVFW